MKTKSLPKLNFIASFYLNELRPICHVLFPSRFSKKEAKILPNNMNGKYSAPPFFFFFKSSITGRVLCIFE